MIQMLTGFCAAGLSFLSFGILWTGVNQWAQSISALLFLALGYFSGRKIAMGSVLTAGLIGAGPLGMLMTQFRDKNDSHLLGILIVASWIAALALGAFLAKPKNNN